MFHALGGRVRRTAPLAALVALGGCFATRSDVRLVQGDLASLRTELLRNDAEMREALAAAMRTIAAANDSVRVLSARTVSIQGDLRGETRNINQQLLQIQQLLGASTAQMNKLRAELEQRNAMMPPPASMPADTTRPPVAGRDSVGAPVPPRLGPSQLYTNATEQLRRNSISTARTLFQELLTNYPDSDYAPDAQYYIAESYMREKNMSAADAAFAAVVAKFPESSRAPTALFKRSQISNDEGNVARARQFAEDVIRLYPRSDAAEQAKQFLGRR